MDALEHIYVVIADDHSGFRQALQKLVDGESDMTVVAAVADGAAAMDAVRQFAPHVALLDVRMPGRDGIDVARGLSRLGLPVRTVVMTMHWDRRLFERASEARVTGYLTKETALLDVLAAIRSAARGEMYVAPLLSGVFPPH